MVRHLLRGLVVPGETFFSVTILFSRMYNFDSLYKDMNSKKIILLLDTLAGAVYHMKAHFDIFQVESSSETYVVRVVNNNISMMSVLPLNFLDPHH